MKNTQTAQNLESKIKESHPIEISKPLYYTLSLLTLGLPQTLKFTKYSINQFFDHRDDFCDDMQSDPIETFGDFGILLSSLIAPATQIATIGYSYYNLVDKVIK